MTVSDLRLTLFTANADSFTLLPTVKTQGEPKGNHAPRVVDFGGRSHVISKLVLEYWCTYILNRDGDVVAAVKVFWGQGAMG
jgi:hypothetical protein